MTPMDVHVYLGNRDPRWTDAEKESVAVSAPDGMDTERIVRAVVDPGGSWSLYAEAGSTPAWVASTRPEVAEQIAAYYGGIPIREPEVFPMVGAPPTPDPEQERIAAETNGQPAR